MLGIASSTILIESIIHHWQILSAYRNKCSSNFIRRETAIYVLLKVPEWRPIYNACIYRVMKTLESSGKMCVRTFTVVESGGKCYYIYIISKVFVCSSVSTAYTSAQPAPLVMLLQAHQYHRHHHSPSLPPLLRPAHPTAPARYHFEA